MDRIAVNLRKRSLVRMKRILACCALLSAASFSTCSISPEGVEGALSCAAAFLSTWSNDNVFSTVPAELDIISDIELYELRSSIKIVFSKVIDQQSFQNTSWTVVPTPNPLFRSPALLTGNNVSEIHFPYAGLSLEDLTNYVGDGKTFIFTPAHSINFVDGGGTGTFIFQFEVRATRGLVPKLLIKEDLVQHLPAGPGVKMLRLNSDLDGFEDQPTVMFSAGCLDPSRCRDNLTVPNFHKDLFKSEGNQCEVGGPGESIASVLRPARLGPHVGVTFGYDQEMVRTGVVPYKNSGAEHPAQTFLENASNVVCAPPDRLLGWATVFPGSRSNPDPWPPSTVIDFHFPSRGEYRSPASLFDQTDQIFPASNVAVDGSRFDENFEFSTVSIQTADVMIDHVGEISAFVDEPRVRNAPLEIGGSVHESIGIGGVDVFVLEDPETRNDMSVGPAVVPLINPPGDGFVGWSKTFGLLAGRKTIIAMRKGDWANFDVVNIDYFPPTFPVVIESFDISPRDIRRKSTVCPNPPVASWRVLNGSSVEIVGAPIENPRFNNPGGDISTVPDGVYEDSNALFFTGDGTFDMELVAFSGPGQKALGQEAPTSAPVRVVVAPPIFPAFKEWSPALFCTTEGISPDVNRRYALDPTKDRIINASLTVGQAPGTFADQVSIRVKLIDVLPGEHVNQTANADGESEPEVFYGSTTTAIHTNRPTCLDTHSADQPVKFILPCYGLSGGRFILPEWELTATNIAGDVVIQAEPSRPLSP